MMFLIRFWSNLTKKDSVESAKYEKYKKIMLVLTVLGCFFFFMDLDLFFRIGSGFSTAPDPD